MDWQSVYKENGALIAPHINEICKSLFEATDIDYFCYMKVLSDNSMIHFTNKVRWLEHYIDNQFYLISNFRNNLSLDSSNYVLCSYMQGPATKIATDASNLFDIKDVITIIERGKDDNEFFQFGSSSSDGKIIPFYLSNFDLLKTFIYYFKYKSTILTKQLDLKKVVIPASSNQNSNMLENPNTYQLKNELYANTKRFYLMGSDEYLTKQEFECLRWLAIGKSAEEIGLILNISKRTAESHIDNIKFKFGYTKQTQIVRKAVEIGLNIY